MNKKKLLVGGVLVFIVFFSITFIKNWGVAVSGNLVEKYAPVIKALKNDPKAARLQCPEMIAKLEKSLPELELSKDKLQKPRAQKLIADCAFAAGDYNKAIVYLKQLYVLDPNNAQWYWKIADTYTRAGKFGESLHYARLSTQLDPQNFNYQLLYARILAKLGLKNRAVTAYAQAVKVAPFDKIEPTKQELARFVDKVEAQMNEDEEQEE